MLGAVNAASVPANAEPDFVQSTAFAHQNVSRNSTAKKWLEHASCKIADPKISNAMLESAIAPTACVTQMDNVDFRSKGFSDKTCERTPFFCNSLHASIRQCRFCRTPSAICVV